MKFTVLSILIISLFCATYSLDISLKTARLLCDVCKSFVEDIRKSPNSNEQIHVGHISFTKIFYQLAKESALESEVF